MNSRRLFIKYLFSVMSFMKIEKILQQIFSSTFITEKYITINITLELYEETPLSMKQQMAHT